MNQIQNAHFYAGVDGGGTKTLAVIVDHQGNERGRGQAGSANYQNIGPDLAIKNICEALQKAASAAQISLPLRFVWLGLAGVDRLEDRDTLRPGIEQANLASAFRISNDAELILSALEDSRGVGLIAGTGSIAFGRDRYGNSVRAGGWGNIIGDEGSGYDLGRQALQAVARAADGRGPGTALLDLVLQTWNLHTPAEIIGPVYATREKGPIAALATLVFAAARADDPVAQRIVEHAASELAQAVVAVGKALKFYDGPIPLALTGGLMIHQPKYREMVLRRIRRRHAIGQVVVVEEPALSAARAASDQVNE